jgi:hypothetical protein
MCLFYYMRAVLPANTDGSTPPLVKSMDQRPKLASHLEIRVGAIASIAQCICILLEV